MCARLCRNAPPLRKNEAERILEVLEGMGRTPLGEAKRGAMSGKVRLSRLSARLMGADFDDNARTVKAHQRPPPLPLFLLAQPLPHLVHSLRLRPLPLLHRPRLALRSSSAASLFHSTRPRCGVELAIAG